MGTKRPAADQEVLQKTSLNISLIEKESFLEGLNCNDGNPLHSTALEDDLSKCVVPSEETSRRRKKKKKGNENSRPDQIKTQPKKEAAGGKDREGVVGKKALRTKAAASGSKKPADATAGLEKVAGKKPAKRPGHVKQAAASSRAEVQPKRGTSEDADSEEDLQPGINEKKRQSHVLSDDDDDDDDGGESWQPSPKKARGSRVTWNQKSSTAGDPGKAPTTTSGKKSVSGRTELHVMLAAFEEFCAQYRDSVESKAVKGAIEMFSDNVQSQLSEKISSEMEFGNLKRGNAKLSALIVKKKQQLLGAKNELMIAETELCLLKKEEADLQTRLSDLTLSRTLLSDIQELCRQKLELRRKQPKKK